MKDLALRHPFVGNGVKPPNAALGKTFGREQLGKDNTLVLKGVDEKGECK